MSGRKSVKIGTEFDADISLIDEKAKVEFLNAKTREMIVSRVLYFSAFAIASSAGYSIWVNSFVPLAAVWGAVSPIVGLILGFYFRRE